MNIVGYRYLAAKVIEFRVAYPAEVVVLEVQEPLLAELLRHPVPTVV